MTFLFCFLPTFSVSAANNAIYEEAYNIYAALAYADKWTENGEELSNPDYGRIEARGDGTGDCTNFVSQVLVAAGLSENDKWNSDGSPFGKIFNIDAYYAFINADRLREYLESTGYASEVAIEFNEDFISSSALYPAAGDVLQFDWDGDGVYDHSMICLGQDENGIVRFVFHSPPDKFNISFDEIESVKPATVTAFGVDGTNMVLIHMTDTRGLEEVSHKYIGKTIRMKSVQVDRYVSSNTDDPSDKVNAVANRDSVGTWETFVVEEGLYGSVGLRASNGNYLSARIDIDAKNAPLQAAFGYDYDKPQSWESFRIYEKDGVQYLQAQANGKWVQVVAANDPNYTVIACAKEARGWERFIIEEVN